MNTEGLGRSHRMRGVTMIELMIAVAIVGILAAIAQPIYTEYVRRARLVEGTEALLAYRTQMESRYQDTGSYADPDDDEACAIALPPDTDSFTFACAVGADGQTFTGSAAGEAFLDGYGYSIDDAGNRVTTDFPGHDDVNCWMLKRGTC